MPCRKPDDVRADPFCPHFVERGRVYEHQINGLVPRLSCEPGKRGLVADALVACPFQSLSLTYAMLLLHEGIEVPGCSGVARSSDRMSPNDQKRVSADTIKEFDDVHAVAMRINQKEVRSPFGSGTFRQKLPRRETRGTNSPHAAQFAPFWHVSRLTFA